jgi:glycosyltransferase involved in cell wall biosynthesis
MIKSFKNIDAMKNPKVSIAIPTYNQSKYIIRAIESALAQDYKNLEIVISDDNSPDDTESVVKKFIEDGNDDRIKYFKNKENLGILQNYKKSLYERLTGDWVINLDGDDFFVNSNFISAAMVMAVEDSSLVLIFGNYCEFYESNSRRVDIRNKNLPKSMNGDDFLMRYAKGQTLWNHNSIIYKRDKAIKLGFYWDEVIPMNDWESFLRLIATGRVGYLEIISAAWVQHGANETRRLDLKKYLNNFVLIKGVADFATAFGMNKNAVHLFLKNLMFRSACETCIAYFRNRDFYGALIFLRHAYAENRLLPFKVISNPGIFMKALLSLNPSFYTHAKAFARRLS